MVLAYPLAWIIAMRVPARWQRLALMLAILPFWTSYVVRSYAWLLVLAQNGVVNQALIGAGLVERAAGAGQHPHGDRARLRAFLRHAADADDLRQPGPALAEPTPAPRADLGASRLQTFRHVILPLTLPGVVIGAFLTFVLCIGDYITPQILGGNNELMLPQVIMLQIGRRADFPPASALAIVLMAVVTLAYLACARWLRMERHLMRPAPLLLGLYRGAGLRLHLPAGRRAGAVLLPGRPPAGAALRRAVAALVCGRSSPTAELMAALGNSLARGARLLGGGLRARLPRRLGLARRRPAGAGIRCAG